MSITANRRERERAERHRLILAVARELAEVEGWEAVTTRRLAERVEYSQPVLYSHFKGKDAIVEAVAEEGFGELGVLLRRARAEAGAGRNGVRAVSRAYLDFAVEHEALYQAMFVMPTRLKFASEETPAVLRDTFFAFVEALPEDTETREGRAELLWAALHGIAVLSATGRVPAEAGEARLDLLIDGIVPGE
ncbi:TetR/AcrR family transcriptional regulator [Streptomyces sp. SPB074]|uniref:TetR/AcrR family transcriptional regulator n=1 Tax=Streptomyces sp. (strain SPB074) TaxID=465543 RepID=UPI00017FEA45|nr:TetR/AcrR family transcriptional regulator [Streptomyces sp. SPB074]EDY44028.1 TetR-family transcriptional regulator [Streptomyces sp. SPB074]